MVQNRVKVVIIRTRVLCLLLRGRCAAASPLMALKNIPPLERARPLHTFFTHLLYSSFYFTLLLPVYLHRVVFDEFSFFLFFI